MSRVTTSLIVWSESSSYFSPETRVNGSKMPVKTVSFGFIGRLRSDMTPHGGASYEKPRRGIRIFD